MLTLHLSSSLPDFALEVGSIENLHRQTNIGVREEAAPQGGTPRGVKMNTKIGTIITTAGILYLRENLSPVTTTQSQAGHMNGSSSSVSSLSPLAGVVSPVFVSEE